MATSPFKIRWVELPAIHDIHVIESSMDQLTDPAFAKQYPKDDYYAIRLTDRQIIPDVMNRLRQYYPQILSLGRKYGFEGPHENYHRHNQRQSPKQLFADFFEKTVGTKLNAEQEKIVDATLADMQKGGSLGCNH